MNRLIFYCILIITVFLQNSQAEQQRGMWVVRHALSSKNEIYEIISTSKKLNITDIYIQVRALGQVYYKSEFAKRTKLLDNSSDNLRLLIKQAKENSIKVHAWLNALYIWSGKSKPLNKQHLYYISKKAILRTRGNKGVPEYDFIRKNGMPGYFVDAGDTNNLRDIKQLITELIINYDIDGIHLDYFRYPDLKHSFSPIGRTKFMIQNFIDPDKIYSDIDLFINKRGYLSYLYADKEYRKFLRSEITGLLINLKEYIKTIDKSVLLSIAVKPNMYDAKHVYFQDWGEWLKEGLCDRILMMNYQTDFDLFIKNVKDALTLNKDEQIVVGISTYNQDEKEVFRRISFISDLNLGGYSLFSYNYLNKNKHILNKLCLAIDKGD
jgi:uncharacterized lipoprotein YddW (UPF0748 family)